MVLNSNISEIVLFLNFLKLTLYIKIYISVVRIVNLSFSPVWPF